jgi:glutaredoxin-like protein
MPLFDENIQKQLREIFKSLKNPVQVIMFTQEFECPACRDTHTFLEEICALSDKLNLTALDFVKDEPTAQKYGVDKIPAVLVLPEDKIPNGIRFYGPPGGYEINSFIKALEEVSGNSEELPPELQQRIKAIEIKIHIQVFITPSCPYCPGAVVNVHRLALENPNVTADMVEATTFPQLAIKYHVMGVPKIVINETHELMGAQPLEAILNTIEQL